MSHKEVVIRVQRILYFFIEFTPNKTLKPLRHKCLVCVEELKTGKLLGCENRGKVIRKTVDRDWHFI